MTTANNVGPAPSDELTLETCVAGLRSIRWNHSPGAGHR
jgi:hypothetical protein